MAGSRQSLESASGMKPGAAPSKGGKLTQAQKVKIAVAVVCIVVGVGLATYSLGLFGESAPPTEAPANYDPAAGAVEGASKAQEQRAAELQRMRDAAAARGQPLPEGGS